MSNKAKLCISGMGFWHRIWLKILTGKAVKPLSESVSVVFQDKIKAHRYSSLWYGGKVAVIQYKECQFLLEATGDVYANFLD